MKKMLILVIVILLAGGMYFYTQNQAKQLREDTVQSPIMDEKITESSTYKINGEIVTFVSGGTFPNDGLWHATDYDGNKLKIDYSNARYSESYMSDGERVFVSTKEQSYNNFSELIEIMKRPYDGPGGFRLLVTGPTDANGILHATRVILHRE